MSAPRPPNPAVGLCSCCRFAAVQPNARGDAFWRCGRSDDDAAYLRYPPLPISSCPGYEEGRPEVKGAAVAAPRSEPLAPKAERPRE